MTPLAALRQALVQFLTDQDIRAFVAWPTHRRLGGRPIAIVSIQTLELEPAGFQNYLGERLEPETQVWQEVYGLKATITFALDLFSPKGHGETACQTLMEQVAEALQEKTPSGLAVQSLSWGETAFDRDWDGFHGRLLVRAFALFWAVAQENGQFSDFEVRGVRK